MLTIEGQLAGDYVRIAGSACGAALSTGISVTVFLKDVREIDANGRALLRQLMLKGARLRASGVYWRYVVRSLEKSQDLSSQRSGIPAASVRKP
jgi:hypothetical protein